MILDHNLSIQRADKVIYDGIFCHARPMDVSRAFAATLGMSENVTMWRITVPEDVSIKVNDFVDARAPSGDRLTPNHARMVVRDILPMDYRTSMVDMLVEQVGFDRESRFARIQINGVPADVSGLDAYLEI